MRFWPQVDPRSIQLPQAPGSAPLLLAALSCQASNDRAARLADLLALDPSLAAWTVLQFARSGGGALKTTAMAAAWLLTEGLPELCRAEGQPEAEPAFDLAAARRLASESVQAAWLTQELAADLGEAARAEAYFAALLSFWPGWLKLSGGAAPLAPSIGEDLNARSHFVAQAKQMVAGQEQIPGHLQSRLHEVAADAGRLWEGTFEVAALFPQLLSRLVRLEQLDQEFQRQLQEAKLGAMKEFAYGAGHEINNPLANISARAQTLLKEEADPERRRKLAAINAQAFRAHEMIADMMLFARPPQLIREPFDVVKLVDRLLVQVGREAEPRGTALCRVGEDGPMIISADPSQLLVALRALCSNAIEALGRGGRIEISARSLDHARVAAPAASLTPSEGLHPSKGVEIAVSDNGPGISAEVIPHLFDPFYSGREAGRGLGFGLSKCWRIVNSHGGQIVVDSTPGRGATFTITLPGESGG